MYNPIRAFLTLTPIILLFTSALAPKAHAQGSAAAYCVMDATTGHVLSAKDDDRKLQIGSLTNIATAMVVLDWAQATHNDLAQEVTVPAQAASLHVANPIGFQPGDHASMRDLLYAALMQSDDIASLTLSFHIGRSLNRSPETTPEVAFVAQMNALARRLKMERTLFLNSHGLDNLEGKLPYSTAADMARLASYAMAKSNFRFFVSQKERQISIGHMDNTESHYLLRNTNELLGANAVDGVRTGATSHAGQCVIISSGHQPESVQKGDSYIITPRRLIVVVLGSNNRFNIAAGLLNRGWQLYEQWATQGRPMKRNESLVL